MKFFFAVLYVLLISSSFWPGVGGQPSPTEQSVKQVSPLSSLTLSEWNVPSTGGGPWGIAFDEYGKHVWFTENATNKLARFDPATNNFAEWAIPTISSSPRNMFLKQVTLSGSLATRVYFTEYAGNKIAYFDPTTGNFTEYQLPILNSDPVGVFVDERNDIWFTESGRDVIGRIQPGKITNLTEWKLPGATNIPGTPVLKPWGIYVQTVSSGFGGTNRFVWFTEMSNNRIGRLEIESSRLTLWDLGTVGVGVFQPMDLKFDSTSGGIVFTSAGNDRISFLGNDSRGGSTYSDFNIRTLPGRSVTGAKPTSLALDPARKAVWITEYTTGIIASANLTFPSNQQLITPSYCTIAPALGTPTCASPASMTTIQGVTPTISPQVLPSQGGQTPAISPVNVFQGPLNGMTEYRLPDVASLPNSIVLDVGGNIWFTESNVTVNKIGRLSIPYVFQLAVSPGSQTINIGQTATFTVSVTVTSGNPLPVQLSLLNAGNLITNFSPQTGTAPFTSTLTVTTGTAGTYSLSVVASSGGQLQQFPLIVIVQVPPPPPFDYSIGVTSPLQVTIEQGGLASFNLQISLVTGNNQSISPVSLTAAGFPSGATFSFSRGSGLPPFTSTLSVQTTTDTPAGSYPITVTGTCVGTCAGVGGTPHYPPVKPSLQVTELLRDFNMTAPAETSLVQASRQEIPLAVTSLGVFSSPVEFSYVVSPAAPGLTISFSPSSVTPSPGNAATTTLQIVALRSTPTQSYQLTIIGTSGSPARTHQIKITVRVSPCLIATATFGSELSPEVEFLRNFRDQRVSPTFAGTNFMIVFNEWYYSFSPAVAQYEYSHSTARMVIRYSLYPLMGILHSASKAYDLVQFQPEFAVLMAGLVASSLIGFVYLSLPVSCILIITKNRVGSRGKKRIFRAIIAAAVILMALFVIAETLSASIIMMIASVGLVLMALTAGTILPATIGAGRFKREL